MKFYQKFVNHTLRYGLLTLTGIILFLINVVNYGFVDPLLPLFTSTVFIVYIFWTQELKFGLFISLLAVSILAFFKFFTQSIWFLLLGAILLILHKVYLKNLLE